MANVRRLVLDVLKPHQPNALDFARAIADLGKGYLVKINVLEMDENTETLQVTIEGESLDFDAISAPISASGASLHSIDEVAVAGE